MRSECLDFKVSHTVTLQMYVDEFILTVKNAEWMNGQTYYYILLYNYYKSLQHLITNYSDKT